MAFTWENMSTRSNSPVIFDNNLSDLETDYGEPEEVYGKGSTRQFNHDELHHSELEPYSECHIDQSRDPPFDQTSGFDQELNLRVSNQPADITYDDEYDTHISENDSRDIPYTSRVLIIFSTHDNTDDIPDTHDSLIDSPFDSRRSLLQSETNNRRRSNSSNSTNELNEQEQDKATHDRECFNETERNLTQSRTRFHEEQTPNQRKTHSTVLEDSIKQPTGLWNAHGGSYEFGQDDNIPHQRDFQPRGHEPKCESSPALDEWTLDNDDLYGPKTLLDDDGGTQNSQSYKPHTTYYHGQAPNIRIQKFPRMFHSRSNADTSSVLQNTSASAMQTIMATSPLMKIAEIAKSKNLDIAALFETASCIGLPELRFPCMQCYEKSGGMKGGFDEESFGFERGTTEDGKCSKCGGQVMTAQTYGKMICGLRKAIQDNNLVAYDVYPDGNCLFGAIIDQLRVRGNFTYTINSIRAAAVNYLRHHPNSDDGTPFEMFLSGESWPAYLARMSEDGEWGDHMVIRAISNILNYRIVIYGGMGGEGTTKIVPKCEKQDEGSATSSDDKATKDDDNAVDDEDEDEKYSHLPCMYLAHIGESHYISLRPHDWQEQVQKGATQHTLSWFQRVQDDGRRTKTNSSKISVAHLDFVMNKIFQLEYIKSYSQEMIDMGVLPLHIDKPYYETRFLGSITNKLEPEFIKIKSLTPDVSFIFQTSKNTDKAITKPRMLLTKTPKDSAVVFNDFDAKKTDLIGEMCTNTLGLLRLVPRRPRRWDGHTFKAANDHQVYLMPFEEEERSSIFDSLFPKSKKSDRVFEFSHTVSFKSEWPMEGMEWFTRPRKEDWPNQNTIETVASVRCHVVPVLDKDGISELWDDYFTRETIESHQYWSLSFAVAEQEVCRFLTEFQRHCFLLLRLFVDNVLHEEQLPTYILRHVFLYACEQVETEQWKSSPANCFLLVLKKLAFGLQTCHLPHYFLAEKNCLQNIPETTLQTCSNLIDSARRHPLIFMYFLLDKHGIIATELGSFLDDMIEDSARFAEHTDIQRSFNETVIAANCLLIRNCAYQGQYRFAYQLFAAFKSEYEKYFKHEFKPYQILKLVQTGETQIGYTWCLALCIDMNMDTCLTRDVCHRYEQVHISEVFGPAVIGDLPDTCVPACFSIPSGDLKFVTEVNKVLHSVGSPKVKRNALRYYVETYNEMFGADLVICSHRNREHPQHAAMCPFFLLYIQVNMELYYAYLDNGAPEDYKPLVPHLTSVVDKVGIPYYYEQLRIILKGVGEVEKAKDLRKKTGGMASEESMLKQLFGMY